MSIISLLPVKIFQNGGRARAMNKQKRRILAWLRAGVALWNQQMFKAGSQELFLELSGGPHTRSLESVKIELTMGW